MKEFITIVRNFLASDGWGKGSVNLPYNVQWLIKALVVLLLVALLPLFLVGLLLYGIYRLLLRAAPYLHKAGLWIWHKMCAFGSWIWKWFLRFLKVLIGFALAIRLWFSSLGKRSKSEKPRNGKKSNRWIWWVLILLLLLLSLLLWQKCSSPKAETVIVSPTEMYEVSFDKVVVARAYLDGVQSEAQNGRVLVGLKYVNGKSLELLQGVDFDDLTYEQAIAQIAADWKPVVVENLNPDIHLDEQQMIVVTLTAMRMGPKGFRRSTFCQKVNVGDFDGATQWLCLQKADGSLRTMGKEAQLYFYMLKQLWTKQILVTELVDFPMFSYKNLSMDDIQSKTLTDDAREKLRHGCFKTPREALGL